MDIVSFFNLLSLMFTFMFLTFLQSSACSLPLPSVCFFFYWHCILTVSLPPLFHFCLVFSLLSSSSTMFLYFSCLRLSLSVSDFLVHTQLHHNPKNTTLHHMLTHSFSQEPSDPTSPAACGSPGHSRFGENTPGLWGRQGRPAGLSLPTLWAHAALLHR